MLDEMQLMLIMSTAEICSKNYLITHHPPIYGNSILDSRLMKSLARNTVKISLSTTIVTKDLQYTKITQVSCLSCACNMNVWNLLIRIQGLSFSRVHHHAFILV